MLDVDANATTPVLPEVLDAMLPWLRDGYANPSGSYGSAKRARAAIDEARVRVANLIGAEPEEIVFTGGGTESVNTAMHSLARLTGPGAAVVSAIEHSAVLRGAAQLGREVRMAPVTADGRLDPGAFAGLLDGAAWVSVMMANNETGVLQPVREVVELSHARGMPVHSDAIQAVGKIPVAVRETGVDLLSLSAHKFHGPKGVGALYVRRGLAFEPLLHGGGQENGRRGGTENTAGIVGMGAAAACAMRHLALPPAGDSPRDAFEARVLAEISGVSVHGGVSQRLPNTSQLTIEGCASEGLLILLDEADVACSAGSACLTGKARPSHVLLAMGVSEARAKTSLRVSFSRLHAVADAVAAADALARAVTKLRRVQGPGVGPVMVYSA